MSKRLQASRPDEDNPLVDEAFFARARPASEVLREILPAEVAEAALQPKRGRPQSAVTKTHVNLRLDPDVVAGFKARGKGWQTVLNGALREWLETHGQP